jgi:predicted PurR-regulated permease PerM
VFGEHFLGVWGLILGIPIFIFFLDLVGVDSAQQLSKKEETGTK